MKESKTNILSLLLLLVFLCFWICVFILSLSPNRLKKKFTNHLPKSATILSKPWHLFSPPPTYNLRLYLITRSIHNPTESDTTELLENLSFKKRRAAPFNQPENLVDNIVNNNVSALLFTIWTKKRMSSPEFPDSLDSLSIANAIQKVEYTNNYIICLASIKNYGMSILKKRKMNLSNKELKWVIKEKVICPFGKMDNIHPLLPEKTVFETIYQSVNP